MGEKYLTDTNVVIDYLNNKLPATGMKFMNGVIDEIPNLSVITKIELLRFNTDENVYQVLNDFVEESNVLGLADEVVNTTIIICKENRIKLPDAIIAATALRSHQTLLTRNVSDFRNIKELKLLNPWTL